MRIPGFFWVGVFTVLLAVSTGLPAAFDAHDDRKAAIIVTAILFSAIGFLVALYRQWQEITEERATLDAQTRKNREKWDTIHADILDIKATYELKGSKKEAAELSAQLLRFIARREDGRPTPQWAYENSNRDVWQRVFFSSSHQHISDSLKEYEDTFRARVSEICKKLGGDDVLESLNQEPHPLWPTEVRMISERLADHAEG